MPSPRALQFHSDTSPTGTAAAAKMKFLFFFFVFFVAIAAITARPGSDSNSDSDSKSLEHTKRYEDNRQLRRNVGQDGHGLKPMMSYPAKNGGKSSGEDSDNSNRWKVGHKRDEGGITGEDMRHNKDSRHGYGYDPETNKIIKAAQSNSDWMKVQEMNRKAMESQRGKKWSSESHGSSEEQHRSRGQKDGRHTSEERRGDRRNSYETRRH